MSDWWHEFEITQQDGSTFTFYYNSANFIDVDGEKEFNWIVYELETCGLIDEGEIVEVKLLDFSIEWIQHKRLNKPN